jgi:lipopolysaccharide transport system permease protein
MERMASSLAAAPSPIAQHHRTSSWAQRRDLLRELIARDLKLRYRGSIFGALWTLLNPLAELIVLLFIFDRVLPLNIPHYGPFLFTGLLVFGWFQTSLTYATVVIVGHRELVRRPAFPVAILPVVSVGASLVHFAMALPVLAVLLLVNGIGFTSAAAVLPVLVVVQFIFTLCLAYPLAALHVWFRDTQYLLKVALQLLFFLTPVFYASSTIPPAYLWLYRLNPMVMVVNAYRAVLIEGRMPDGLPLVVLAIASSVVLAVGVRLFRQASHRFGDEL